MMISWLTIREERAERAALADLHRTHARQNWGPV